jgi:hypothetical protein
VTTESQVVGDDHATLTGRAFENIDVRSTNELFVPRRAQIAAARAESVDDVRSDVLV